MATVMISITIGDLTYYLMVFGIIAYILSFFLSDLWYGLTGFSREIMFRIFQIVTIMAIIALALTLSMFVTTIIIYNGCSNTQLAI